MDSWKFIFASVLLAFHLISASSSTALRRKENHNKSSEDELLSETSAIVNTRRAAEELESDPFALDSDDGGNDSEVPHQKSVIMYVVDGDRAPKDRYPFYTSIINSEFGIIKSIVCGGSLVAPNVVLSAAHCTDSGQADEVRIGAYAAPGLGNGGAPHHTAKISKRINHPKYDSESLEHDVALFKLDRPVTHKHLLNNMIDLDFDRKYELNAGEKVLAVGLGRLNEDGTLPAYLQEVELEYVPNFSCRFRGWPLISDDMMCAADPDRKDGKNQDTCSGDSGGPLLAYRDGKAVQVGIVSFGSTKGCGSGPPGVYSRISESADWIKNTICTLSPTSLMCPDNTNSIYRCEDLKDCSYISSKWRWIQQGLCLIDDFFNDCDETCNRCDA